MTLARWRSAAGASVFGGRSLRPASPARLRSGAFNLCRSDATALSELRRVAVSAACLLQGLDALRSDQFMADGRRSSAKRQRMRRLSSAAAFCTRFLRPCVSRKKTTCKTGFVVFARDPCYYADSSMFSAYRSAISIGPLPLVPRPSSPSAFRGAQVQQPPIANLNPPQSVLQNGVLG